MRGLIKFSLLLSYKKNRVQTSAQTRQKRTSDQTMMLLPPLMLMVTLPEVVLEAAVSEAAGVLLLDWDP